MREFSLLFLLILLSVKVSETRFITREQLNQYKAFLEKYGDTSTTENSRIGNKFKKRVVSDSTEKQPPTNHETDAVCRTIYDDDMEALLKIQGAANEIQRVIDRMDIESRPSSPVSAFINIPKYSKSLSGQDIQRITTNQLLNKEGFTISYDDKKSLERIKIASDDIMTQLLHMGIEERPTKPRPTSPSGGQLNTTGNLTLAHRQNVRRSISQDLKASSRPVSIVHHNKTNSEKSARQSVTLQTILNIIDNRIDDVGRKLKEEYVDNTNLERTDIKSISDTLKKLQGMITATNRTLLKQINKIFEEQTEVHSRLEKELNNIEKSIMKLLLDSVDKKINEHFSSDNLLRHAKDIEHVLEASEYKDDMDIAGNTGDDNDMNGRADAIDDEYVRNESDYYTED